MFVCVYVYSNSTYIVLAEIVPPLAVVVADGAEGSLICALLCRAGATASPLNTTRRSLVFSYALWWVVCAVIDFFLHFNFPRLPTFTCDCLSLFLYAAAAANFSCAYQLAFYFSLFFFCLLTVGILLLLLLAIIQLALVFIYSDFFFFLPYVLLSLGLMMRENARNIHFAIFNLILDIYMYGYI